MKVYVPTCDKYRHIISDFAFLFNKHWSEDQEVVVLGYSPLDDELPPNFSFVSMGVDSGVYTDGPSRFFQGIHDPYFVVMMDDTFLIEDVDINMLNLCQQYFQTRDIGKIIFDNKLLGLRPQPSISTDFLVLDQSAEYRTSLNVAMWSRDYFMKFLKPGLSAQDFEIKNMPESMNDGVCILAPKERDIMWPFDMYRYGNRTFNEPLFQRFKHLMDTQDLAIIQKYRR